MTHKKYDNTCRNEIRKVIFHETSLKKNVVKFYIVFIVEMVMLDNDNKISTSVSIPIPFRSKTYTVSVIDKESIKKK
jgi:Na+/alanine symporter